MGRFALRLCQPSVSLAEFTNMVAYARKFEGQIKGIGDLNLKLYPDVLGLTVGLIEAGSTAWGIPEFEIWLKDVFMEWVAQGYIIRAQLFAEWLLTTTGDPESQRWLTDFAKGNYGPHMSTFYLRCPVVAPTEESYLYPLRFDRLIYARKYRAAVRSVRTLAMPIPGGGR